MSEMLPDPTGASPRFLMANDVRNIYRNNMEIVFPNGGVFVDTIKIVSTTNANDVWSQNSDWITDETCLDDFAASDARNADTGFNRTLVKKIIIRTNRVLPVRVALSYQNYWDLQPWTIPGIGDPIQFTPDVLSYLMTAVAKNTQQIATVQNTTALTGTAPVFYPEDLNQEIATNWIAKETYNVNTSTGINLIRPTNGPFFRDTLVVSVNGTVLTEGKDYQVDTFDKNRTRKSRNVSGIYWAIMIISAQAGPVDVAYHPVGGRVTQDDVILIWNRVRDMTTFLNNLDVLTSDTLTLAPVITSILWRLDNQDETMRRLLAAPNYTNSTSGTSVQKVFTATDSNLHWYDIAHLYKVTDSGQVVTADRFKGRIFFPGANVAWTFTVEANINQPNQPITFSTESLLVNPGTTLGGASDNKLPIWPMLRAVWNTTLSGITLQVGVALTNLTDNPVIEDLSSAESCWLLDQTNPVMPGQPAPATTPIHDSGFVLPDGSSVWGNGYSEVYLPPTDDGYAAYSGKSVVFSQMTGNGTSLATQLPNSFPVNLIRSATVYYNSNGDKVSTAQVQNLRFGAVDNSSGNPVLTATGVIPVSDANDVLSGLATLVLTLTKTSQSITITSQITGGTALPNGNAQSIRAIRLNP